MCRESLESPFLLLVREYGTTTPGWRNKHGWLGPNGCRLKVGRPPVCYEFLCRALLTGQPNQGTRNRLISLARLISQAGRRALGGDHLVEIMTPERLARVKPQRLSARFDQAESEINELKSFWDYR